MIPCQCRFVATDTDLFETLPFCNVDQTRSDLLWRIELSSVFGMCDYTIRPTEDTTQTAAYTVGRGDASVERCGTEAVVFPLVAF